MDERRDSDTQATQRGPLSRRQFLQGLAGGLGAAAFGMLATRDGYASSALGGHFPARAKRVIYLHMVGGTSHIDLFDPKPLLTRYDGKPCPPEFVEGKRFAFLRGDPEIRASPYEFERAGASGMELSNLLPHHHEIADQITLVRSAQTDEFNHTQAQLFLLTGFGRFGRPSLGSWLSYGLGSVNADLPAFVSLVPSNYPGAGNAVWGSGFLPTVHQGVEFRSEGEPVLFLGDPPGIDRSARREMLDSVNRLNRLELEEFDHPEIETRIQQYEMSFRMQASVPGVMDIADEPDSVLEAYGADKSQPSFANACLLARRLVERDVRFVQIFDSGWDHHTGIDAFLPVSCKKVDRPVAALVRDLAERGLLEDTLVVFATEFGRTPMAQSIGMGGEKAGQVGRDHHSDAFSVWLAGGGVKAGHVFGETDDFGFEVTRDPAHVHDLNATILHLLGLDHERLTYRFQGREYRLTDVHGEVLPGLLA